MLACTDWTPGASFWDLNPGIRLLPGFEGLYQSDTSRGKKKSSCVAWVIVLVCDYESKVFNVPEAQRKETVSERVLGTKDWFSENPELASSLMKEYESLQEDSEKRYLRVWNEKLDQITQTLLDWKVDKKNIGILTKILLDQEKLMEQKDKITQRIAKSERFRVLGGKRVSIMESGEMEENEGNGKIV